MWVKRKDGAMLEVNDSYGLRMIGMGQAVRCADGGLVSREQLASVVGSDLGAAHDDVLPPMDKPKRKPSAKVDAPEVIPDESGTADT